jgi:hypothetical protein
MKRFPFLRGCDAHAGAPQAQYAGRRDTTHINEHQCNGVPSACPSTLTAPTACWSWCIEATVTSALGCGSTGPKNDSRRRRRVMSTDSRRHGLPLAFTAAAAAIASEPHDAVGIQLSLRPARSTTSRRSVRPQTRDFPPAATSSVCGTVNAVPARAAHLVGTAAASSTHPRRCAAPAPASRPQRTRDAATAAAEGTPSDL